MIKFETNAVFESTENHFRKCLSGNEAVWLVRKILFSGNWNPLTEKKGLWPRKSITTSIFTSKDFRSKRERARTRVRRRPVRAPVRADLQSELQSAGARGEDQSDDGDRRFARSRRIEIAIDGAISRSVDRRCRTGLLLSRARTVARTGDRRGLVFSSRARSLSLSLFFRKSFEVKIEAVIDFHG